MHSDDATERRLFDLRSSQRHNPERWFPYFLNDLVMIHAGVIVGRIVPVSGDGFFVLIG